MWLVIYSRMSISTMLRKRVVSSTTYRPVICTTADGIHAQLSCERVVPPFQEYHIKELEPRLIPKPRKEHEIPISLSQELWNEDIPGSNIKNTLLSQRREFQSCARYGVSFHDREQYQGARLASTILPQLHEACNVHSLVSEGLVTTAKELAAVCRIRKIQ